MKETYTLAELKKAIEMARLLHDGENIFEVENILGSADGTYGISIMYEEDEIIKNIQ